MRTVDEMAMLRVDVEGKMTVARLRKAASRMSRSEGKDARAQKKKKKREERPWKR